jgi:hypothetical protein
MAGLWLRLQLITEGRRSQPPAAALMHEAVKGDLTAILGCLHRFLAARPSQVLGRMAASSAMPPGPKDGPPQAQVGSAYSTLGRGNFYRLTLRFFYKLQNFLCKVLIIDVFTVSIFCKCVT